MDDFDPDGWQWLQPLMVYRNNLKQIENVTKQIIEIEELREEKLAKRNTEQI